MLSTSPGKIIGSVRVYLAALEPDWSVFMDSQNRRLSLMRGARFSDEHEAVVVK